MQVRPLEHQLDRQIDPRLRTVAHHQHELGEVVHHLIEQLDLLAQRRNTRAGNADRHEQRQPELDTLRVERIHPRRVDGDLRRQAVREHRHRPDVPCRMGGDEIADVVHAPVRIGRVRRHEPVGVRPQGAFGSLRCRGQAHQADVDPETIHLGERHRDRVGFRGVFGHVVEHVRRRHRERFLRLAIAEQLLTHRGVELVVIDREPDHRVDDADRGPHAFTLAGTARRALARSSIPVTLARSGIMILTSISTLLDAIGHEPPSGPGRRKPVGSCPESPRSTTFRPRLHGRGKVQPHEHDSSSRPRRNSKRPGSSRPASPTSPSAPACPTAASITTSIRRSRSSARSPRPKKPC